MLAGAGVAIGVAWGGLLAHFAAGAFLLILRPFKVGDFISAGGTLGTVKEIGLFCTTIVTPDNVMTVVGNNKLFSDNIQNFTALPVRRVDRIAQLAHGVDPLDAIARFRTVIATIPNVATDPAPEVSLFDFKLEGPQITVRPYTHNDHYWQVWFDTNEAIARVCAEAGWPPPAATYKVQQTVS
jgi:small conductance mechanosensitive channel